MVCVAGRPRRPIGVWWGFATMCEYVFDQRSSVFPGAFRSLCESGYCFCPNHLVCCYSFLYFSPHYYPPSMWCFGSGYEDGDCVRIAGIGGLTTVVAYIHPHL